MSHLRQLNNFIYNGDVLKEKILREERNWWFKRKYPKEEYVNYLKKARTYLEKEEDKYSKNAIRDINEELGDGMNLFKSGPGHSVNILEYVTRVFKKLISKAFKVEKKKQSLSVAKTLQERLAGDSVVFGDNPIEPELMEKISGYISDKRLEQGTKHKIVRENASKKKKRTKKHKRTKKRKRTQRRPRARDWK